MDLKQLINAKKFTYEDIKEPLGQKYKSGVAYLLNNPRRMNIDQVVSLSEFTGISVTKIMKCVI